MDSLLIAKHALSELSLDSTVFFAVGTGALFDGTDLFEPAAPLSGTFCLETFVRYVSKTETYNLKMTGETKIRMDHSYLYQETKKNN